MITAFFVDFKIWNFQRALKSSRPVYQQWKMWKLWRKDKVQRIQNINYCSMSMRCVMMAMCCVRFVEWCCKAEHIIIVTSTRFMWRVRLKYKHKSFNAFIVHQIEHSSNQRKDTRDIYGANMVSWIQTFKGKNYKIQQGKSNLIKFNETLLDLFFYFLWILRRPPTEQCTIDEAQPATYEDDKIVSQIIDRVKKECDVPEFSSNY